MARGTTATYPPIQRWVRRQYGFVPKTCWIAHCKELKGLPTRSNWNRGGARQVPCPENTRSAIYAAFLETGQHAGQPLAWTGEASRIGSGPFPGVFMAARSPDSNQLPRRQRTFVTRPMSIRSMAPPSLSSANRPEPLVHSSSGARPFDGAAVQRSSTLDVIRGGD